MSKRQCSILTNYEDITIHAIFHVVILLIVLTAFFFIVVENLEKSSLSGQLINGIKNGLKDVYINKDENIHNKLIKLAKLYKNPDKTNEAYNRSLFIISLFTIATLLLVFITLVLTLKLSTGRCINIFDIIIENMLLFICVGVVEYLFFINIGMKYIPVKPSYMGELINKTLNN